MTPSMTKVSVAVYCMNMGRTRKRRCTHIRRQSEGRLRQEGTAGSDQGKEGEIEGGGGGGEEEEGEG